MKQGIDKNCSKYRRKKVKQANYSEKASEAVSLAPIA